MADQRVANLKKKAVRPPAKKEEAQKPRKSFPEKIVFLYYSSDCLFCRELIRILIQVPYLSKIVKCINVKEYDPDPAIDAIPTIDDPNETGKTLHKLDNAFTWVIHQCYNLLEWEHDIPGEVRVSFSKVAEIEASVEKIFRDLQRRMSGEDGRVKELMRQDVKTANPYDKYKSLQDADADFGEFDYTGKHRTKDLSRYPTAVCLRVTD